MDIHYDNKPSMISETTFCRPNRYRTEAPLYFACYGVFQASDAIVHFAFDEPRLKDVPKGTDLAPGNVIDPLVHYAGRTGVRFTQQGGPAELSNLSGFLDRAKQVVTSTNRQLRLDYGKGLLLIDAPAAQGACGALAAGPVETKDLSIRSPMDLGSIVVLSLDGRPLSQSRRMLLQAMSEERTSGFAESPEGNIKRITSIGRDRWTINSIAATVLFKRADAPQLNVTVLDLNGYPVRPAGSARSIELQPGAVYYLVEKP